MGAIGAVIDSARVMGSWWLATGREVADWWLARHNTEVVVEYVSPEELELTVSAPTEPPLEGAWVSIDLPSFPEMWTPFLEGRGIRYALTDWGVSIPLDDLAPGRRITIRLSKADSVDPPS